MSYKIKAIPYFEKAIKQLTRKYPSLKQEYQELIKSLKSNPFQGSPLINNCFKIRVSIASKGRGKSDGARVITCIKVVESTVYLLTIYDKSDKDSISNIELKDLIKWI